MAKLYSLLKFCIFIAAEVYIFKNFGKLYGFIGLGIIIVRFLHSLGILRSPKIFKGAFNEGVAYLKDYKGSYRNKAAFEEASQIIKKFNLKDFSVIGIFYDRPNETKENEFRYSVGVFRKNIGFPEPVPEEFEIYCKTNNYYSAEFPVTTSLYSMWDYSNKLSMVIGIFKFYKSLIQNLSDNYFKKMYKVSGDPKTTIEIYSNDSKVEFYLPLFNHEKFFVYKYDEKPKNE